MTRHPPVPPLARPRPDLPVGEAAWLALWRAFWADLPLAWAGEIDRFLFRWVPSVGENPTDGYRGASD